MPLAIALLDPHAAEFWVLVSFLLFMALIVYYKVPGMIACALDDRSAQIRKELDDARKLREEAAELLADYQRKARAAEDEAKSIIEQARREAETLAAETRKSLVETVERRTRLANEKIARAETQALAEVRAAAVDAAVQAAEKLIAGKVGGEAGAGLVDQAIRDLKAGKLN